MPGTVTPAICLEGFSLVDSGVFLSLDRGATPPAQVRAAPRIDGVVRVFFDEGSIGALSVEGVLLRNASTLARWVDVVDGEAAGALTDTEVDRRGDRHGLPIDVVGRADLIGAFGDRGLPIDNDHRVVSPSSASGVRVLPRTHVLDRDHGLTLPSAMSRDLPFPGQLRFAGEHALLGLPSSVVAERHAGETTIPAAPAETIAAAGYADLLAHLGALPVGSRTSVVADGTTFLVINDRDGLSTLRVTDGQVAPGLLPRQFSTLRYAGITQAGDSIGDPGEQQRDESSWVSERDIAVLRAQVPPRVLRSTTVIDVAERLASTTPSVPRIVRDSYRLARRQMAPFAPVKPQLRGIRRDLAYDHRELIAGNGSRVQDFEIRLHVRPDDGDAGRLFSPERLRRIERAAGDFYNAQYRIGPGDDQFNVRLVFVDNAADAHLEVTTMTEGVTTQRHWTPETTDLDIVHELAHTLGLFDEYVLEGVNAFIDRDGVPLRWALKRHDPGPGRSIMQTTDPADNPRLEQRHLDRIANVPRGAFQPDGATTGNAHPETSSGSEAEPLSARGPRPGRPRDASPPPAVGPTGWIGSDVANAVMRESSSPSSRWWPVEEAVRGYISLQDGDVGGRRAQLAVISGSLDNWVEHHSSLATNLRTFNRGRVDRLRRLGEELRQLVRREYDDLARLQTAAARSVARREERGEAVPIAMRMNALPEGAAISPDGSPSPVRLSELRREFDNVRPLPQGVQVQIHLTNRGNYAGIGQQGLRPGAAEGIGLPTGGRDRTYVYTLTGSVPRTSNFVSMEVPDSAAVGVLTTGRGFVRDSNYPGGANQYGNRIPPVRTFEPEAEATYSFTLPASPRTAAGIAAFVNQQRAAENRSELTVDEAVNRVRAEMFRRYGFHVTEQLASRAHAPRSAAQRFSPPTTHAPYGYPQTFAPSPVFGGPSSGGSLHRQPLPSPRYRSTGERDSSFSGSPSSRSHHRPKQHDDKHHDLKYWEHRDFDDDDYYARAPRRVSNADYVVEEAPTALSAPPSTAWRRMSLAIHPDDLPRERPGPPSSDPLRTMQDAWQEITEAHRAYRRTRSSGRADILADVRMSREEMDNADRLFESFLTASTPLLNRGQRERERELRELDRRISHLQQRPDREAELGDARNYHVLLTDQLFTLNVELANRAAQRATQRMVPAARDLRLVQLLRQPTSTARRELEDDRAAVERVLEGLPRDASGTTATRNVLRDRVASLDEDLDIFNEISHRTNWEALRDAPATALVLAARRGRRYAERERNAAMRRFQRAQWSWLESYPDVRSHDFERILDRAHNRLVHEYNLVTTTNLNRMTAGGRTVLDELISGSDARFRNFWETSTTGGAADSARRGVAEERFGYAATLRRERNGGGAFQSSHPDDRDRFNPGDMDRRDLPKYAALVSPERSRGIAQFGNVSFHWSATVRGRSTITPGDSFHSGALGAGSYSSSQHAYPLLAYGREDVVRLVLAEATNFRYDPGMLSEVRNGDVANGQFVLSYFEAQIHGDLGWADVERVVISGGSPSVAQQAERLRDFRRQYQYRFRIDLPDQQHRAVAGPANDYYINMASIGLVTAGSAKLRVLKSDLASGDVSALREVLAGLGAKDSASATGVARYLGERQGLAAHETVEALWESYTFAAGTLGRSGLQTLVNLYEQVHQELADLDPAAAHPLPPIEQTLAPSYFTAQPVDTGVEAYPAQLDEQELPTRTLRRAQPLGEQPSTAQAAELDHLAAQRLQSARELSQILGELSHEKWLTGSLLGSNAAETVRRQVTLVGFRHLLTDAAERLKDARRRLPTGVVPSAAEQAGFNQAYADVAHSSEALAKYSETIAHQVKTTIEHRAVNAVVGQQETRFGAALDKFLATASTAANMGAGMLIPTGMSWATALVNLGTTGATQAATHMYQQWQSRHFSDEHTLTEALHEHQRNPLLMAEQNLKAVKEGFGLFMAAAGIGGGYVPGWAIISAALAKIGNAYLDAELQLAKDMLEHPDRVVEERVLSWRLAEDIWTSVRTEIHDKVKDPSTLMTLYGAATGEADVLGLAGIGSDIAVAGIIEIVKAIIPLHPEHPVTESTMLDSIRALAGAHVTDGYQPVPTISRATSFGPLPEGVPERTIHGHRVLAADAHQSQVQIEYHGAKVWGSLDGETGEFTPVRLDDGSYVPQHVWKNRTVGRNSYSYKITGSDGREREVLVRGTWSEPFAGTSFTKVFRTEDGRLEWGQPMAPTSTDSDEYNLHKVLDPSWFTDFVWEPQDVLSVDHGHSDLGLTAAGRHPEHDPWAMEQKASWIARRAVALSLSTGRATDLLTVHVEGGGHGHNALRRGFEHLTGHDENARAQETGRLRAASVRAWMVERVGHHLGRFADKYRIAPGRVPAAESLFAPATSRGTATTTRAPGRGVLGEEAMRQTFVWADEHEALSPGAFMPGPDELAEPAWMAQVRAGLVPADENVPNVTVFAAESATAVKLPAGLADAARQRPDRQFLVVDGGRSGKLPAEAVAQLNLALVQFQAGGRTVTPVVRGTRGPQIDRVLSEYGAGVVLEIPAGLGRVFVSASPAEDFVYDPALQSETIGVEMLDDAALSRSAQPVELPEIDEAVGGFLYSLSSVEDRFGALKAQWQHFSQDSTREQIKTTVDRVPDVAAMALAKPLLDFGPEDDTVVQVMTRPVSERPAVLAKVFADRLADGTADAEKLATISDAATRGADRETQHGYGPFVTGLMLDSIEKARAGQFADAEALVRGMKGAGKLTGEQINAWTTAVGQLRDSTRDLTDVAKQQFLDLQAAIAEC
ncbi:hypothetical protein [Actinoplanes sp. RD1]|uniref:hypothetical protein n=1 Tax=Actinoplanes sp. RD1 TaxID=3064538 RepID=UPI0027410687|nr:hypothetical protein [Actinoplanes sp. RD1]